MKLTNKKKQKKKKLWIIIIEDDVLRNKNTKKNELDLKFKTKN